MATSRFPLIDRIKHSGGGASPSAPPRHPDANGDAPNRCDLPDSALPNDDPQGDAAPTLASAKPSPTVSPAQTQRLADSPPVAGIAVETAASSKENEQPGQNTQLRSLTAAFNFENDEEGLWADAFEAYTASGGDWTKVTEYLRRVRPDPENHAIAAAAGEFHDHRSKHAEVFGILTKAMDAAKTIISVVGDPFKTAFPPASIIISISNVFFEACERVSNTYDVVKAMLKKLHSFLDRLKLHTTKLEPSFRKILVKILGILFEVIGFTTSTMLKGRMDRLTQFFHNFGDKDKTLENKKNELDRLMNDELKYVAADTRQDGKQVISKLDSIADKIQGGKENTEDEDREKKLKPSSHYMSKLSQDIENDLVPNTGAWIQENPEFQAWKTSEHPILLISGPTGVGKTSLCGNIIKRLVTQPSGNEQVFVTSFFGSQQLDIREVLRTWAFDLASKNKPYSRHVNKAIGQEYDLSKIKSIEHLWERLFMDFLPNDPEQQRKNYTHVYLVLDGLDVTNTRMRDIDTLLMLIVSLRDSPRNRCNHKDAGLKPNFYFRVLISARLDGIDSQSYTGLNHLPANEEDFKGDINQYIKFKLEADTRLSKEERKKYTKKLSDKADTFAYAFGMINWVEHAENLNEISQQMKKGPSDSYGVIRFTLKQFEAVPDEACEILNKLLGWVIYSHRRVTLEDLDCVFKIDDRYGRGISNLEDVVKSHPSLFRMTTGDVQTSTTADMRRTTEVKESLSATYTDIVSTNLKSRRKKAARLSSASISISQPAIREFFDKKGKGTRKVGVNKQEAHMNIARSCMSLFCNDKAYAMWRSSTIARYAENYFHYHVKEIHLDEPSNDHVRKEVSDLILRMFFDQKVLSRWTSGTELIHIRRKFLHPGSFTDAFHEWVVAACSDECSDESLSKWLMELKKPSMPKIHVLRPLAECFASRWLQTRSRDVASHEFEFLAQYMDILPEQSPSVNCEPLPEQTQTNSPGNSTEGGLHVSPHNDSTATESNSKSKYNKVLRVANHFRAQEDSTWHLRVAQILKSKDCLDECKAELNVALEMDPNESLARYELEQVHASEGYDPLGSTAYLESYRGFDAAGDISNKLAVALSISNVRRSTGETQAALKILEEVWSHASSVREAEEELHYAYVKSIVTLLARMERFEDICSYFDRLAEDELPTGESRLARYCLKETNPPLITVLVPVNNVQRVKPQASQIVKILEHCLEEARLTGHLLTPILQDHLAWFLLHTTDDQDRAFELWNEVLLNPSVSDSSLFCRSRANATRYLSSMNFTKALLAKTLNQEEEAKKYSERLQDISSRGIDPTQRMGLHAHCTSLMHSAWLLMDNSVKKAHENFKRNVALAIDILEDYDEANDVSAFLMLAEVFMTTGVDDEDASSAMSLFLQYRFDDDDDESTFRTCVECDACGESCGWGSLQVCRYCKADFCDECFPSMKNETTRFRLCHPSHEFSKPRGRGPGQLRKGYVLLDGKEVRFLEWVEVLKKKWAV